MHLVLANSGDFGCFEHRQVGLVDSRDNLYSFHFSVAYMQG
jgi:hypothetical protein